MLVEVNKLVKARVSENFIKSILHKAFKVMGVKAVKDLSSLSVALVGAQTIKKLNRKYRRVNKVTDVLSFDDPAEIIICWSQLVKQAVEFKHSQKRELAILLIHGFLHILGYDHQRRTERLKMDKAAAKILEAI